jgi:CRISPR-associated protein Cas6
MNFVDVSFALRGIWVPRDHGYLLYGAICRVIPGLHEADWLAVHPIGGVSPDGDRLHLGPKAELRMRVPSERIGELLLLAGRTLEIGGLKVMVGVPTIFPLVPAPTLDARLVLIKVGGVDFGSPADGPSVDGALEQRYRAEIERQLGQLEIRKPFQLLGKARLTVRERTLVGFAVRVSDLTAEESLRLMENGVGGRRRMGAGIFRPARGSVQP